MAYRATALVLLCWYNPNSSGKKTGTGSLVRISLKKLILLLVGQVHCFKLPKRWCNKAVAKFRFFMMRTSQPSFVYQKFSLAAFLLISKFSQRRFR
jgi:hypothetical protein